MTKSNKSKHVVNVMPVLLLLTSYFWYSFWFEMATMVVCQRWPHELIMRWRLIWAKHIVERIYCKDFDFLLFFCVVFLCKNISTSLILTTADNEKLLNSMLPLFVLFCNLTKAKVIFSMESIQLIMRFASCLSSNFAFIVVFYTIYFISLRLDSRYIANM